MLKFGRTILAGLLAAGISFSMSALGDNPDWGPRPDIYDNLNDFNPLYPVGYYIEQIASEMSNTNLVPRIDKLEEDLGVVGVVASNAVTKADAAKEKADAALPADDVVAPFSEAAATGKAADVKAVETELDKKASTNDVVLEVVTATRTALSGYRLGPDSASNPNRDKPLASEAEAEALRTAVAGKLDKSSVVAPSTSGMYSGMAADAKATGDALANKLNASGGIVSGMLAIYNASTGASLYFPSGANGKLFFGSGLFSVDDQTGKVTVNGKDVATTNDIPKNVSAFSNDAGYVTEIVTNGLISALSVASTYATKTEVGKKQDILPYLTNAIPWEVIADKPDFGSAESLAWEDMTNKVATASLIPGQQYRITNYVATVAVEIEGARAANNGYDIIVVADTPTKINETARAALREYDDGYFANSHLDAWEVKYCLANDTRRFTWADAANGKGVVYRLKDERGNECPYDFKNIQFIRYALIGFTTSNLTSSVISDFSDFLVYSPNNNLCVALDKYPVSLPISLSISEATNAWYYTFDDGSGSDASVGDSHLVLGNAMGIARDYQENARQVLNGNVFFCRGNNGQVTFNKMGVNCIWNTFVGLTDENVFGDEFIGNLCYQMQYSTFTYNSVNNIILFALENLSFQPGFTENVCGTLNDSSFGSECQNNILNSSHNSTYGTGFSKNVLSDNCIGNIFGAFCKKNSLGNYSTSNVFSTGCEENVLTYNCQRIIFGTASCQNELGSNCSNNKFGSLCTGNKIGDLSHNIEFGPNCRGNIMGLQVQDFINSSLEYPVGSYVMYSNVIYRCTAIHSGAWNDAHFEQTSLVNQGPLARYQQITIEGGNCGINLYRTATGNKYYQNVTVGKGINSNEFISKVIMDSNTNQTFKTTYVPQDSQVLLVP